MMLNWKGILIHHSLTKDSGTVSWQAIRNYHEKTLGWRAVGYHFGIESITSSGGTTYEILAGRPLDWFGSHERRVNRSHIGICFVGNYDEVDPPTEMLRVACERIIRPMMKAFDIPREAVEAHRDYKPSKSCPGNRFQMPVLLGILDALPPADFSWRP
jgi:hypothetical protein